MDELINVWVEEQLALSPAWSAEKQETIFALLGIRRAGQADSAAQPHAHLPQRVENRG
ncbi:hypothetical protein ACFVXQ_07325 [Kitasatospora sp. NPDC058263]